MRRQLPLILTPQSRLNLLWQKNSPSSRRRQTTWGHSRWQIENFSCDHVLIPSNIWGHSELSMFRNKKKIGEYRIEIGRVRCGRGFYCYTHSITHSFNAITLKMIISNLCSESRKCYLWKAFKNFWESMPPNPLTGDASVPDARYNCIPTAFPLEGGSLILMTRVVIDSHHPATFPILSPSTTLWNNKHPLCVER